MKLQVSNGFLLVLFSVIGLYGQSTDHIQESRYKPFTVLIISPDTAQIDDSLNFHTESIEKEFKSSFYKILDEFEQKRNGDGNDDNEKLLTETVISRARWFDTDVTRFKYYHMISIGTFVSLKEDFQRYPWERAGSLDCQIVNRKDLDSEDMVQLTKDHEIDYVIYFKDIHADRYADSFIMYMTTYLFSKYDSKVIMKKKAFGEADESFCELYKQNPLECMMTRILNESTSDLFEKLNELQKR
ncbi:MAG: hypothetical protein ACKVOQ_14330 [Cyclobacteriaceae bacterium]